MGKKKNNKKNNKVVTNKSLNKKVEVKKNITKEHKLIVTNNKKKITCIWVIKRIICFIFYSIFSAFSFAFIISSNWALNSFGNINFSSIFYHVLAPMEGTGKDIINQYIAECVPSIVIYTIIFILFSYLIIRGTIKIGKFVIKIGQIRFLIIMVLFIYSICYSLDKINFTDFINNQFSNSDFIENNYVDPNEVSLTFPAEKRNLIYIFLESMEYTYEDMGLMPELENIQKSNVNFNRNKGAYVLGNSSWTIAGMVAQTSGIPLNITINGNDMDAYDKFLPGLTSLGNILENNGYNNYAIFGSDKAFAGRSNYLEQHGNYHIWDVNDAIKEGYMSLDDKKWWGFLDSDLFKYAKEQLTNIDKGRPFNYMMLTTDTHHPEGYVEESCEVDGTLGSYANSINCSSKQVEEFINWAKRQDWYENTTIILSGDHTSMNKTMFNEIADDYIRTTYFTIINPGIIYNNLNNREYSTYDMFPTTLASLGVTIDGDRLGLGTNLFSSKYTLTEVYGYNNINNELNKNSTYYFDKFYQDAVLIRDAAPLE